MRKLFKSSAAIAASVALGSTIAVTTIGTADAATCSTVSQCAAGSTPTLKVGKRSNDVKRLQRALTKDGYKVPATGYYGTITRSAVIRYQKAHGIPTTGVTASLTWGSLQKHKGGSSSAPKAAPKPAAPAAPAANTAVRSTTGGKAAAVNFALAQLGKPYAYGATGPNAYDCSGLTGAALKAAGISIPRTSQAQLAAGQKISLSQAQPGDLIVYYSGATHIGIYIGDGKIVHSSRPGKPVSIASATSMPINAVVRF
ncbi:cell wall-associated NlpC family hydrolase [Propionibacteriaceae bacterium ES.041]|uniref:C40 family peptidase n=1 Tax=Enemella evansiae TaxID=2016499 RepID=UPI000B97459F|nr:NlpC/P60 family protein [Enemella evansiae]OYO01729.1 hypothetical protein CGZ96_03775 [Enemella evansiae]PFG68558.1 cell wall-associated NlpC family hydrolase [Propionibacteriaceae bacterium ES.041]